MSILSIILSIVTVFNIGLGAVIFFHGPRKKADLSYVATVLGIIIWSISIIIFWEFSEPVVLFYALATSYFAGVVITLGFWFFANEFNTPGALFSYPLTRVIFISAGIALVGFAFFSPDFISAIRADGNLKIIETGYLHVFYVAYIIIVMSLSFIKFFRDLWFGVEPEKKKQILYIVLGTFITTVMGIFFNLVMVEKGNSSFVVYGPISTILMVGFISYAVIRQNLMQVKIIAAEIFAMLVSVVLFSRLAVSQNPADFIFNGSLFIFAVIFGYLLIRSVAKEIENREKIAELAEELKKSNEELKRLDEAKSEFISIASHQLRSPLTAVKGYISILLEGTFGRLTAGQIEALHKIYVSTEHLIKLIDDLLNLSRIESGRMHYDFKKTNLLDLAKEIIEEYGPNLEKKHLRIIITEPAFPIPLIEADPDKIRQGILNLIDNAIRYTDKGGAEVRFYHKEVGGKEYLGMVIEDSGRGIEKDDIEHLFTKFVRAERTRKLYTEGTGLGLYVAKKIIDDHEGRIYVESEGIGKGSSFFVELPIAG